MSTAVQIRVTDPATRFYLQQYPFLTGPDEAMNQSALKTIRQSVHVRNTAPELAVIRIPRENYAISTIQLERVTATLSAVGQNVQQIAAAEHDYAWRVQALPPNCKSVLCIGSGEGHELAFIRARLPQARIVVMDYVTKVLPGLLEAAQAEFLQGDLVEGLRHHKEKHDAVFSNHTLEHMYDPEDVLCLVFQVLLPGGVLVSGLPMDADPQAALQKEILDLAQHANRLHALDMGLFDAGHPWKTHPADVAKVLRSSGFGEVSVMQRADVPARTVLHGQGSNDSRRARGVLAYRLSFAPARAVLKRIWPNGGPVIVRRLLVAAERRVPFGANRLQSQHSPDMLIVATKS